MSLLIPGIMADGAKLTLFSALHFLKETFDQYAQRDENKGTMSKKELAELLREQGNVVSKNKRRLCSSRELRMLSKTLVLPPPRQTADIFVSNYFTGMDQDGDSKITFKEYMDYLIELYIGY